MIRTDEQRPLQIGMPLTTGDRLGTSLGRVEIALDGGVLLHLDHHTSIDLLADDLVRMLDGRLRVTVDVGSGGAPSDRHPGDTGGRARGGRADHGPHR